MGNPSESHRDEVEVKEEKTKNIKEDNPRDEVEDEDDEDDESDDGDDNVYEVERVAGHMRDEDNVLAYLIKWKGYDEKDNTYEKIVNCDDLIADYWERYEAAGGKRSDPEGREPKPQVPKRVANRHGKSTGSNRSSSHAPEPLLPDLPSVTKDSRESPAPKRQRVSNESRRDPVATKRQKGDDYESEVEDDDEEDKEKKTFPPAEWASWDEHIREVQTVEKLKDSMVVHVLWKNGRETEHKAAIAHQKFPQKLIHFYESHLKFTQA
ncbi:hypothetical protein BGZ93_004643 [Podila epicladia]|nr:hypothetical protein BGZ92_010762 [Podila epicladia]KAG0100052.1 hypothetical protein BGZ93_004643 [Podila epicladia]